MDLRDRLRTEAGDFVPGGHDIQGVFIARAGLPPFLYPIVRWIGWAGVRQYIVVSTAHAHVLLFASRSRPPTALGIAGTLPRSVRFGPLSGRWGRSIVEDQKIYIHRRFHADIVDLDDLSEMDPPTNPVGIVVVDPEFDPDLDGAQ
ncbi:hypothetical protein [Pseudonocardia sp. TRM90224]|uniref:hypothetical protein n=1 Tax=Pseudonocardia sp. TRM90224 TaxID=2812678 RepID=UPI001E31520A|nr:hypothetical protein [Pseudonocardia sp. TRM90224]